MKVISWKSFKFQDSLLRPKASQWNTEVMGEEAFFSLVHRTKPFPIASPNVPNDGSNCIRRIIYCDWLMLPRLLGQTF